MTHRPTITHVASVVVLIARVLLGGLMVFAASKKLMDPIAFADGIKAFHIIPVETGQPLIIMLAFVTPWTEMLAGLMLVFGLWTRASSLVIGALLLAFIGGLLGVIFRENISASCSCFGDLNIICGSEVGWCHVVRNTLLLGLTFLCFTLGGGLFSIDGLFGFAKESLHGPALGLGQGAEGLDSDD